MERCTNRCFAILTFLVLLSLFAPVPFVSGFISGDALKAGVFSGRNLQEALKACPVNFEGFKNYTIFTHHCKAPDYPADKCCGALKKFACPYADLLNDLNNDCAYAMFYYINLHGHYPTGLFSSKCVEGPQGLSCPSQPSRHTAHKSKKRHPTKLIFHPQ